MKIAARSTRFHQYKEGASMKQALLLAALAGMALNAVAQTAAQTPAKPAKNSAVERGKYLVAIGGCHDCHTPKVFGPQGPKLDMAKLLSGHPAAAPTPAVPPGVLGPTQWGAMTTGDLTAWAGPWGISYSANLTPDATGLKGWTPDIFIKAMRTGKHMGEGRPILPPMPWEGIGQLTDSDLKAVFAYLQSLKPISNSVPPPVAPTGAPGGAPAGK